MKLEVKHYGRIKAGKIIWSIPDLYNQQLLELEGCDIVMTMKKRHEKPSLSQYGYYRGAILIACYQSEIFSSADNKDQIHDDYFSPKFLSYKKMVDFGGQQREVVRYMSLADLSKDEMSEFIQKVLAECNELGIEILPPELFYNKYYK